MPTSLTLFDEDDLDPAPAEPLVRVRLTVAYDGTPFHGFARNPGVPTVGGRLTEALERVLRHPVELTCAGSPLGEIVTRGRLVDPEGKRLAGFRQTYQLWRGSPVLLIDSFGSCSAAEGSAAERMPSLARLSFMRS